MNTLIMSFCITRVSSYVIIWLIIQKTPTPSSPKIAPESKAPITPLPNTKFPPQQKFQTTQNQILRTPKRLKRKGKETRLQPTPPDNLCILSQPFSNTKKTSIWNNKIGKFSTQSTAKSGPSTPFASDCSNSETSIALFRSKSTTTSSHTLVTNSNKKWKTTKIKSQSIKSTAINFISPNTSKPTLPSQW